MKPQDLDDKEFRRHWRLVAKHTHLTTVADLPRMSTSDLLGVLMATKPCEPMNKLADRLLRRRLRPKKKALPFKLVPSTRAQSSYLGGDPNFLRASNAVIVDDAY